MRSAMAAVAAAAAAGGFALAPAAAVGEPSSSVQHLTDTSAVQLAPLSLDGSEDSDWWYDAMRVEQAHRRGATGAGVKVALVDEPLDMDAVELQGQDVRLRTNCDDVRTKPLPKNLYEMDEAADHGTSMASLIVGSGRGNGPGGAGVAGVAPEATLLAYNAGLTGGMCRGKEIGTIFDRAVKDGADIISMSMLVDEGIVPAVRRALRAGVVVVAGLPYEGSDLGVTRYPAGVPGVVAVQPVDREANAPEWALPQRDAVIASPGVHVGSVRWNHATGRLDSEGYGNGTSPATAIVSGALALVKSKYPKATGDQLVQHLIHEVGGEKEFDWNPTHGFGIVSVTEMLKSSPSQWPDENPLLGGPKGALRDYPAWVSSRVQDPPGKGENAPEADSVSEDAAGGEESAGQGTGAGDAAGEPGEPSGMPGWLWPVAGLLVVLAGAVAVVARRRGGGTA
jgi:hypothetical protein